MIDCRFGVKALAVAAALCACAPATAQTSAPRPSASPRPSATPASSDADLTLDASAQARSVRFDVVPNAAHVSVSGVNQIGGVSVQTNLPPKPQAGKTYRNVRIQLHAAARFVNPGSSAAPSPRPTPR